MMKRVKWFLNDLKSVINCMLLHPKFKALSEGDPIYWKNTEALFIGLNYYGLPDGFLPQYSVIIELDDGCCHEIPPEIISIKKRSAA